MLDGDKGRVIPMRKMIVVALMLTALPLAGHAQQAPAAAPLPAPPLAAPTPPPLVLPEIVIGGEKRDNRPSAGCVEVQTGNTRGFKCLNDQLQRQVERINPSVNLPPVDAKSSDIKIGIVNMPAVQQQYGRNFGKSVIPFRPPLPTYSSPLRR